MKEIKTNAMRILDKQKLAYQVHTYPHHDKEAVDGGERGGNAERRSRTCL